MAAAECNIGIELLARTDEIITASRSVHVPDWERMAEVTITVNNAILKPLNLQLLQIRQRFHMFSKCLSSTVFLAENIV